jgi:hypothetical protein
VTKRRAGESRPFVSHNPVVGVRVVPAAIAVLVLVAGCGGSADSRLDVLELEQLASFVAPGGTIEDGHSFSDGEISRVFAYEDTAAAETGREAAIEAARASGWELTFDGDGPGDPIFGAKELSTGDIRLVIGQYEEGDIVKVSIRLELGSCARCRPGGQEAESAPGQQQDQSGQQSSGALDDPLSVPGTILVLPSAPNAWAGGPYVAKLGETVELDGTGSYDRDGRIVLYEWDVDGDGEFDVSTPSATVMHRFTRPVDGKIALRVTDDTGRTAVAKTYASASVDGDGVQAPADNCPNDENYGQDDWDEDGVGDICDPTPFGG